VKEETSVNLTFDKQWAGMSQIFRFDFVGWSGQIGSCKMWAGSSPVRKFGPASNSSVTSQVSE